MSSSMSLPDDTARRKLLSRLARKYPDGIEAAIVIARGIISGFREGSLLPSGYEWLNLEDIEEIKALHSSIEDL